MLKACEWLQIVILFARIASPLFPQVHFDIAQCRQRPWARNDEFYDMTRIAKKDDSSEVRRITWVGLGWNVVLSAGKFLAGYFGGSQALIADAIHSASDFTTDIAIIIGSRFWNSPPDSRHPYGHRRFETLISVGIGLAVCAVGLGLGYNAVFRSSSKKPFSAIRGPRGAPSAAKPSRRMHGTTGATPTVPFRYSWRYFSESSCRNSGSQTP